VISFFLNKKSPKMQDGEDQLPWCFHLGEVFIIELTYGSLLEVSSCSIRTYF